jgi:hypothetical protein
VGTLAPPFVRYVGLRHRFAFRETKSGLLVGEVQLFASAGAPTYIVILGEPCEGMLKVQDGFGF